MEKEFITIAEAATETGKPQFDIKALIRQKKLPFLRIGSTVFVHRQHLDRAINPPEITKGKFTTVS